MQLPTGAHDATEADWANAALGDSFFGEQEGDFSIDLHAIAAWRRVNDRSDTPTVKSLAAPQRGADQVSEHDDDDEGFQKAAAVPQPRASGLRWKAIFCGLVR